MELSEKILVLMSDRNETVGSDKLAVEFEEDHQKVVGAIKSLEISLNWGGVYQFSVVV